MESKKVEIINGIVAAVQAKTCNLDQKMNWVAVLTWDARTAMMMADYKALKDSMLGLSTMKDKNGNFCFCVDRYSEDVAHTTPCTNARNVLQKTEATK